MNIVVKTIDLQVVIRKVMLSISSKLDSSLSCIKFIFKKEGIITIQSYDLTVSVETSISGNVEDNFESCIKAKTLFDIVQKCFSETIKFIFDEKGICTLKSGKASFKIPTINKEDFPEIPSVGNTENVSINTEKMIDLTNDIVYAVSVDETRPTTKGVCFEFGEGNVSFVATDGYRLSKKEIKSNSSVSGSIIVPSEAISILSKVYRNSKDNVSIGTTKNFITFYDGKTKVTARLISGNFFDWKKAIPKESSINIVVEKNDLIRSIEMAMTFKTTSKGTGNPLVIKISDDKMKISFESVSGSFEDEIELDSKSEKEIEIGFNPKYLIDALKHTKGDSVVLMMNSPLSPCVVCEEDEMYNISLVLPVRLKNKNM